ncbi:MAG: hypothetical protein JNL73_17355 [Anaerolineales bacterium]|nr:hypothetical protein [Anaerolineales bacterium]
MNYAVGMGSAATKVRANLLATASRPGALASPKTRTRGTDHRLGGVNAGIQLFYWGGTLLTVWEEFTYVNENNVLYQYETPLDGWSVSIWNARLTTGKP